LHREVLTRRSDPAALGDFNSLNELFERAVIFHARCGLNAAANINSVWHDGFDREAHISRVQTAREDEKSCER
jgi:hypothetical protein